VEALTEFQQSRWIYPTLGATSSAAVCLENLKRFEEALDLSKLCPKSSRTPHPGLGPLDRAEDARGSLAPLDRAGGAWGSSVLGRGRGGGGGGRLAPLAEGRGQDLVP
jgi:hypothetical protein